MNAPPPAPLECGCVTPKHSVAATAASTADPPSASASAPTAEHRGSSAATAPSWVCTCVAWLVRSGGAGTEPSASPRLGARSADDATRPTTASASTAFSATLVCTHRVARSLSARAGVSHARNRAKNPPSYASSRARVRPPGNGVVSVRGRRRRGRGAVSDQRSVTSTSREGETARGAHRRSARRARSSAARRSSRRRGSSSRASCSCPHRTSAPRGMARAGVALSRENHDEARRFFSGFQNRVPEEHSLTRNARVASRARLRFR